MDETTEEHKILLGMANAMDGFRDDLRVFVAGLVADGFTDREAREIVTAVWRGMNRDTGEEEETS